MIKIGIDGHNLEQSRAGVARTLLEELKGLSKIPFVRENIRFIIYFKTNPPTDLILNDPICEKKVLPHFIRPSSVIFYNIILPFYALRDRVDFCYFPCYMLPLFYYGKAIVTLHDVAYEAHSEWFKPYYRYSYHILSRRAAKLASAVITISDFSKREIMKYYKIASEKIWSIPLAPSDIFKRIDDIVKQIAVKKKYGIENKFIFFVGQIFNRRHIYEAMLAFKKIAKDFSGHQFLVAGRDLTYPDLQIDVLARKINKELGREAIIRCSKVETDEDLLYLYNSADLFVYLSEYEGFGLPPMEALTCGTPILIGQSGVSEEVFGEAAFVVKKSDVVEDVAEMMKTALTNDAKREAVLKAAVLQVGKFSWNNHCENLLDLFKKVANK